MFNFDQDIFPIFLIIIVCALLALGAMAVVENGKHQEVFMKQCMEDHKQYECDALWRAGEDHTTVMPMPIYIGK